MRMRVYACSKGFLVKRVSRHSFRIGRARFTFLKGGHGFRNIVAMILGERNRASADYVLVN
jgi:hypothetical protein